MRRAIVAILLCLLLGLLTSVAVAWGAAVYQHELPLQRQAMRQNGWGVRVDSHPLYTRYFAMPIGNYRYGSVWARSESTDKQSLDWIPLKTRPAKHSIIQYRGFETGWPMRCAAYWQSGAPQGSFEAWQLESHGGVIGRNPLHNGPYQRVSPGVLPTGVLWFGLVVDITFFGFLWLIVIAGVPALYMRVQSIDRRGLNRCAKCNYDTRHVEAACPECGTPRGHGAGISAVWMLRATLFVSVVLCAAIALWVVAFALEEPYAPLHRASFEGDVETINELLDRGADPEATIDEELFGDDFIHGKSSEVTPLLAAVSGNQPESVRVLLDRGALPNGSPNSSRSPLNEALIHRNTTVARILIRRGALIDEDAWLYASVHGQLDVLKYMEQYGGDANEAGHAVYLAAVFGHDEVVEWLVKHGATPGVNDWIGARGKPDHVRRLLDAGVNPGVLIDNGLPAILIFDSETDDAVRQAFLDAGLDVDMKTKYGYPLLVHAVFNERNVLVQWLLEHGANPVLPGDDGKTPLGWAATAHNTRAVELLLEHGVAPKITFSEWRRTSSEIRDLIKAARNAEQGDS